LGHAIGSSSSAAAAALVTPSMDYRSSPGLSAGTSGAAGSGAMPVSIPVANQDQALYGGGSRPEKKLEWDAEGWKRRLEEVRKFGKQTGDRYCFKPVFKEVAEHNYQIRHVWRVNRTEYMKWNPENMKRITRLGQEPAITFSSMTTADALLHYAHAGKRVCGLNFAHGTNIGGGYKNGAVAQEEDLCRRIPSLYTSLFTAKNEGFVPYGPTTARSRNDPQRYCDVLWTPGMVVARTGEVDGFSILPTDQQVTVSLVSGAAPNLKFGKPPEFFDPDLVRAAIQNVFVVGRWREPEVNVLILGAWGCGAFGCDPRTMGELFAKVLAEDQLGFLYEEVHFAIPAYGDSNADDFKAAFKAAGLPFRELLGNAAV